MELKKLSDAEIIERTSILVTKERQVTARLLVHLAEFDERSLYAEKGFQSLYAYLVEGWNYSEAAASRRVTAARAIRKLPGLAVLLEAGHIHLSALQVLAPHLTRPDAWDLVESCKNKSRRVVEEIVARKTGVPITMKETVKVVAVSKPKLVSVPEIDFSQTGTPPAGECQGESLNLKKIESQELRYKISMHLDEQAFKDLKRAQQLNGNSDIATTIKAALAAYLDRKDPIRKLTKTPKVKSVAASVRSKCSTKKSSPSRRKHIPIAEKRKSIKHHGPQCAHIDPGTGRRCTETSRLEFDHVQPHAAGGGDHWENLRPICRAHNLLAARKFFGKEKINAHLTRTQC